MVEPLEKAPAALEAGPDDDGTARRVGTVVNGKWHVDAVLGVGAMAAVFAATHRNGKRCALKILHAPLAKEPTVCERFRREAYVSNAINHPGCVAVLDDDVTEEQEPFLVMELLEGDTLRAVWKRAGRKMPLVAVLQIADRVLDCLVACHAAGVIHRDLKPPNIFITKEGVVKVLDFGVAQVRSAAGEFTATGTALGTPYYMSPEQAMGLVDQLDGRTDIFSVGAIMHALVTGKRIHKGRTENEALILAATAPVPSVARIDPSLPVEVIALIDKALAWDRRVRFADAKEMQTAVQNALATVGGVVSSQVLVGRTMDVTERPPPKAPSTSASPLTDVTGLDPSRKDVPEDDPRVLCLRDLFKRVERFLPTVRQFGWDHPATDRTLRTVFDGFVEALQRDPEVVTFSVRPYSFLRFGHSVWEPGAPLDAIPYNLFACGIRAMAVQPGVTLDEFRKTLELMMLDPGRDLPSEDDIVAAFWEAALAHVSYEVADAFAEGGAAERELFYGEADELERAAQATTEGRANMLEAQAMALAINSKVLQTDLTKSPMALDEVVRNVLSGQLNIGSAAWSERYVEVLADAIVETFSSGDTNLVVSALRASAADLIVAGRMRVMIELTESVVERLAERVPQGKAQSLASDVTARIFRGEPLTLALRSLADHLEWVVELERVISRFVRSDLPELLEHARTINRGPVRDMLFRQIERMLPDSEGGVVEAMPAFDFEGVCVMLSMLARLGSPAAREALAKFAQASDPAIRVEAKILLATSPEQADTELLALLSSQTQSLRLAALHTAARHGIKGAVAVLSRLIKQAGFQEVPQQERREMLKTLMVLAPERGESVALDIAKKAGLFTVEAREQSRIAAIDALSLLSNSPSTLSELRIIAQSRWGTSDDTRAAALRAASLIESRLASKPAEPGSIP